MKKFVYTCLIVLLLVIVVAFIFGTHGDGIASPKIQVTIIDEDNRPIHEASVCFFEKLFEQEYETDPKEFIENLKFRGLASKTDSEGQSTINAKFWTIVHFFRIFNMNLLPKTSIPSDGVLLISKKNYQDKKVIIDRAKYEQEIINEQTISFQITLEKAVKI